MYPRVLVLELNIIMTQNRLAMCASLEEENAMEQRLRDLLAQYEEELSR